MEKTRSILIIHADDVEQHLGRLKLILEALQKENRIVDFTTLEAVGFTPNAVENIGAEDGILVLLSLALEPHQAVIEETLLKLKDRQPQCKIVEIIVDNIPYEPLLIAFPHDLQPIRAREDMDSVWTQIATSLRDMFPAPVEDKPSWLERNKKYLLYAFGIFLVLLLLTWIFGRVNTDDFRITDIQAVVNPATHSGECPHIFEFQAKITASKAGQISYQWIRSDNSRTTPETLIFRAAGTQIIDNSWRLGESGQYWQQFQIVSPETMVSERVEFALRCEAAVTSITGNFVVRQTWSGDFDKGREVPSNAPASEKDFWFQARTATDRVITPQNSSQIRRLPTNTRPTLELVKRAVNAGSSSEINVNGLNTGIWLAMRTSEGNHAAFSLEEPVGPSPGVLKVKYVIWKE